MQSPLQQRPAGVHGAVESDRRLGYSVLDGFSDSFFNSNQGSVTPCFPPVFQGCPGSAWECLGWTPLSNLLGTRDIVSGSPCRFVGLLLDRVDRLLQY